MTMANKKYDIQENDVMMAAEPAPNYGIVDKADGPMMRMQSNTILLCPLRLM